MKDVRNLLQSGIVFNKSNPNMVVKEPRDYTPMEVEAQIVATKDHIDTLESSAPELRAQHLRKRRIAKDKGLEGRAKAITDIISRGS